MNSCQLCHLYCEDAAPRWDIGVVACGECHTRATDPDA